MVHSLDELAIRLHAQDDVVVARQQIEAGTEVAGPSGTFRVVANVPAGHKLAVRRVPVGQPVHKYGQIIGFSSADIEPGAHVHVHNLGFHGFERDYAFGIEAKGRRILAPEQRATFRGIRRADGRVATRNYLAVVTSVNCSATVARFIADSFRRPGPLDDYPNVDGVIALTHGSGCGMAGYGEGFELLQRTLRGYAGHPNVAGVLVLGLGCEVNQVTSLLDGWQAPAGTSVEAMTIQGEGGTTKTVRQGVERLQAMLPAANAVERSVIPASELILGMECGGSDAYSGITANPSLGAAADLLVAHGGTAVFGETPEIYGAEHLLTRRAASPEVGERLVEFIRWWEKYTVDNGGSMDNNPSPGNKEGGLTTILEKSLGALAKGGTTDLEAVYAYAEPIGVKGMGFMDTPGYDPVSVTGLVAGGAHVVCFTTGRGSVFGAKPAPSLKLATNSAMYERMADDMDINCGAILDGETNVEGMGQRIFDLVLATASGQRTKSEVLGFGDEEFTPWQLGAVM